MPYEDGTYEDDGELRNTAYSAEGRQQYEKYRQQLLNARRQQQMNDRQAQRNEMSFQQQADSGRC